MELRAFKQGRSSPEQDTHKHGSPRMSAGSLVVGWGFFALAWTRITPTEGAHISAVHHATRGYVKHDSMQGEVILYMLSTN